jgi:flagellin
MNSINTNAISLNAQRNLNFNSASMATTVQRLSSGMRVNSAKDDAAGIAIAERMNAQVRGSQVAIRNAMDAVSMFQTAEGAMGRVTESIQRIRELAVQAANSSLSADDRLNLQAEAEEMSKEITRVVDSARFNGNTLLDGVGTAYSSFQVGANSEDTIDTSADAGDFDLTQLNAYTLANVTAAFADATSANGYLDTLDLDLDAVNTARSVSGAYQSRFEAAITQLTVYAENTATARGRIMDADYAQETSNLARAQILQQAGTAMVAQANQLPQNVLRLLQG